MGLGDGEQVGEETLFNEEFHDLQSSLNNIGVLKSSRRGGAENVTILQQNEVCEN
jgi:hypothetical protein